MKKFIPLLLAIGITAFSSPASIDESTPDEITVTGKLIDTKCYGMNHVNVDNDHMAPGKDGKMTTLPKCATACAAMGIPVGILEGGKADGKVYVLVTPAGALANHQAKEARVTGTTVFAGSIIPTKVEVKDGGKWVDVTPAAMM
ncbi:MAG TPA: hypothetical protein VJB15_12870 [Rhodothermia bacterium]|nr:hypothetical protein [Rhodothermia bacterium]